MKKNTRASSFILNIFVFLFLLAPNVLARAGGGGSISSGFGDGGSFFDGGGSFGSSISSHGSGGDGFFGVYLFALLFILGVVFFTNRSSKKKKAIGKKPIEKVKQNDRPQDLIEIENYAKEIFEKFQKDWNDFNVDNMKKYLSQEYLKRMVLELKVLQNESRKNIMKNIRLYHATVVKVPGEINKIQDRFVIEIFATAHDELFDTANHKRLYVDNGPFTEYWTFVQEGEVWKLDSIRQKTEDLSKKEPIIAEFASKNNFYFDADFGWLMMPNKGVVFSKTNFKISDINNHVIGFFCNKIVEFYTFIPNVNKKNFFRSSNYIVAQAIIPKTYNNILVHRKNLILNLGPRNLKRVRTESNDFEKKFCLWADSKDQISSFELLTPNFMEKVYALPFELNIEVVGNFLYLYTKSRKDINYNQMLEILSWAFEEMER